VKRRAAVSVIAVAWGFIAIAGCSVTSPDPPTNQAQFVGRVAGTDAFIGINKDGQAITAYVCDGTQGHISIQEWFNGTASNNAFDLTSKGGMRVTGVLHGNSIVGMFITADGKEHHYDAVLASGGDAGLIRIEEIRDGALWVGGWIQLSDGEQRGPPLAYALNCGCYAAHKWCMNAYGVWHDFGPGTC
jgi:hypothetical protein